MAELLISVIIPVYNVEKYLHRCIFSVCKQTYRNLEIIIIDDGSTDSSSDLCDQLAEQDSRIIVIHKQNGGLSEARNVGLDIAHGDLISFIDSDDYIDTSMYEFMIRELNNSNADLVICNCERVDIHGNILPSNSPLKAGIIDKSKILNGLFDMNGWYYVTAWNKLYKKYIFQDIRYPKNKISEDMFVICEIIELCKIITVIDKPLYYYVQRNDSIMHKKIDFKSCDRIEAHVAAYHFLEQVGYNEILPKVYKQFSYLYLLLRSKIHDNTKEEEEKLNQIDQQYKKLFKANRKYNDFYRMVGYCMPLLGSKIFN